MATIVSYQGTSSSSPDTLKVKETANEVALSVNRALKKDMPHITLHDSDSDKAVTLDARSFLRASEE